MKRSLDFIVIGSPKAGTTTLYEWMREHPDLYMPDGKELPFFSEDYYTKGLHWYLESHFNGANTKKLWGKATPQYMNGIGEVMPEKIAKRIHDTIPEAKLIAVLRNPVERAYSHYKMIVRRGHEKRSFEEAIAELTSKEGIADSRKHQTETNSYIYSGEYGRILSYYYKYFSKGQILILFDGELRNNRTNAIKKVFNFLGVDDSFVPKSIKTDFHKGSSKAKTKLLTPAFLNSLPLIPWAWSHAPNKLRRRVNFRINRWNISDKNDALDPGSEVYKSLLKYYETDKKMLEKLIGMKARW